ncbi:hypothetical protein [Cupriavidus necator]|uniref:hypothetical protein n=1 Tax=Cupriavidus necator TaxID=106590 RepID=UPI0012DA238A|nr:hypothetical protein [Cupriavidus necator]QQB80855.1 hypothetical protein I6H87_24490 [Cupriavidus necator]WKA45156.1 hypothetical protein QWP09_24955 [Cupriavidus necator]
MTALQLKMDSKNGAAEKINQAILILLFKKNEARIQKKPNSPGTACSQRHASRAAAVKKCDSCWSATKNMAKNTDPMPYPRPHGAPQAMFHLGT